VPAPFSYLSLKEDKWDSENLKDWLNAAEEKLIAPTIT
jgi:hypothetical protein